MLFLLRVAFWFSLVLLLLPFGTSADSNSKTPAVSPFQAFSAASAAVSDLSQFCTRQPEACVTGSQAAVTIGDKAQAAAGMMLDFLSKRNEGGASHNAVPATVDKSSEPVVQNTLTPADRAPAWRGPQPRPKHPV